MHLKMLRTVAGLERCHESSPYVLSDLLAQLPIAGRDRRSREGHQADSGCRSPLSVARAWARTFDSYDTKYVAVYLYLVHYLSSCTYW
jgi:hypothetical protein